MIDEAIKIQLTGNIVEDGNVDSKMGFRFDVNGYTVRIFNKPGRKLITCTCDNGTRFCNEPSLCKHKIAGLMEWIKICK